MKKQILFFATVFITVAFVSCRKESIETQSISTPGEATEAKMSQAQKGIPPSGNVKGLLGLFEFNSNLKEKTGKLADAVPNTNGTDIYTNDRYGQPGKAIKFNGRYGIDIYNVPLELKMSVAAWVKYEPTVAPMSTNYFVRSNAISPWFAQDATQYWGVICTPTTEGVNSGPMNGNWHHITATYDGTTLKFYVDGIFSGSKQNPAGGVAPPGFTTNYQVGYTTFPYTTEVYSVWYGSIDDLRFYSKVLSASEVQSIYNL